MNLAGFESLQPQKRPAMNCCRIMARLSEILTFPEMSRNGNPKHEKIPIRKSDHSIHLWNIAGRDSAAYLAALAFHCTFVFALSTAFTCLHAKYSTQNPKAKSSINAEHGQLSPQGAWKFGEYSHLVTHQTAKEDCQKTEKRRRSLTTCLTAFGFDPTPKRALTATTELAGRPVLYNKLGWTFKPEVGSSWKP